MNLTVKNFVLYNAEQIRALNWNTLDSPENSDTICSLDSGRSFFETCKRKRKRPNKVIKNAVTEKNRHLVHKCILAKCGCRRNWDQIISKDEWRWLLSQLKVVTIECFDFESILSLKISKMISGRTFLYAMKHNEKQQTAKMSALWLI